MLSGCRAIVVAAACLFVPVVSSSTAMGEVVPGHASGTAGGSGPGVQVSTGGSSGSGGGRTGTRSRGGGSGLSCDVFDLGESIGQLGTTHVGPLVPGAEMLQRCTDRSGQQYYRVITIGQGAGGVGAVTPATLGELAVEQVPLEVPAAQMNPSGSGLVNLPVILWVTNFAGSSRTVSAGGVSATAVTTPRDTLWVVSGPDGAERSVRCAAGVAWTEARDEYSCSFRPWVPGLYSIEVTLSWTARWLASTGESGDLGVYARSSTVTLDVHELDTIITD